MVKTYGSVSGQSKQIKTLYGSVNGQSKKIKKLYASVNGQSKLIYNDSGYTPTVPYGIVYYKANASDTTELSVELQSEAEFNSLSGVASTWWASIGGETVTVRGTGDVNVITGVDIGYEITSIPNRYLAYCSAISHPVILPDNVISIGTYFLAYSSINSDIVLSSAITSIPSSFLRQCSAFNKPLTIPSSVTTIGNYFMHQCASFNSQLNLPQSITRLNQSNFMHSCTSFNQPLVLPAQATYIQNYPLRYCSSFNNSIVFPSGLTYVANFPQDLDSFNQPVILPNSLSTMSSFMANCPAFNQPIALPPNLTLFSSSFRNTYAMVSPVDVGSLSPDIMGTNTTSFTSNDSTAPMYTQGIPIKGANRQAWLNALPNSDVSPYRKLIDGGE